jgi:hypothetical protein
MTVFDPGNSAKYKEMMEKARKVNAERDKVDRSAGASAPTDDAGSLRDAISAIAAGIDTADWAAVCEGLDLLQRAELRIRERTATRKG